MSAEGDVRRGMWGRLIDWTDTRANPVLIRDLRLFARGRKMVWTYFFILAILVLAGITSACLARWNDLDGGTLLHFPVLLLSLTVGAAIPNLVGERFRSELSSRATELALVSPLTPARLVRGKLLGAWCLTLQAVSLAAPIFATAYLVGGVTVLDMLLLVAGILLAGLVMPLPQMYMATKARMQRSAGKIIFSLTLVGNMILMYAYASFLYEVIIGDPWDKEAYIVILASILASGILYGQFLYFLTVSRLRGVAENRELAPRLSLSLGAAAGGVSAFYLARYMDAASKSFLDPYVTAALSVSIAFCLGITLLANANTDAPRLPFDAPRRGLITRMFFSNGASSLTAYFLLNIFAVLVLGLAAPFTLSARLSPESLSAMCVMLSPVSAVAYGFFAYFYIVRLFRRGPASPSLLSNTIVVTNIVMVIVAVFSMILVSDRHFEALSRGIVYGGTPLGLFIGAFDRGWRVLDVQTYGVSITGLLLLSLLPMALASLRRRRGNAP